MYNLTYINCRHLKVQIQEAINSRQLSHLVKGIKKRKAKLIDTPRGEGKKDKSTAPAEAPILMINIKDCATKNTVSESMAYKEGIMFPPVTRVNNAPVIIEAAEFERKVGRVYMDIGSTCKKIGIVVLTIHGDIKFHTKKGVRTVLSVGEAEEETKKAIRTLTISKERIPSCDDTKKIIVNDKYPEQMVTIRKQLTEHFKKDLRNLLRANADIFTWTHADVTGIPRTIMNDEGWRMCVDFADLNKACLKDCYPLPEIDWKIKSFVEFCLKCFLDAYKGYHQIQMAEGDEEKTAFFVGERVFCYEKMPFGLKNAGATYQRRVDKVFSKQIGRNLEAYVDEMVIKSTSEKGMLTDIQETFERFRLINMKLNLKKVAKWAIELGKHNIIFLKRDERETPADFLPEIPFDDSEKRVKEKEVSDPSKEWKLYTDGASSSDGAGAGLVLIDLAGKEYTYSLRFEFETTNNEADYEALLAGLRVAQEMEITKVAIFLDSQLVVNQIKEQQGPHVISEVHKDGFYTLVSVTDHSLIQKPKGTSLGDIGFEAETKDGIASWEEGTCIWVLEGTCFCRVGGFF
nr:reverse transcriptase domain-containing protein [Tanacetum cinerariifolium]